MTDPNTRTASPSPERIELPGGWYFRKREDTETGWFALYRPDGIMAPSTSSWYEHEARAFAATFDPRSSIVVPEGYWLAPIEPTAEIVQNAQKAQLGEYYHEYRLQSDVDVRELWIWLREAAALASPPSTADAPAALVSGDPVTLTYTNWRGETAARTITPTGRVLFTSNEWHPEPQWLVEAHDEKSGEVRLFALAGFGTPPAISIEKAARALLAKDHPGCNPEEPWPCEANGEQPDPRWTLYVDQVLTVLSVTTDAPSPAQDAAPVDPVAADICSEIQQIMAAYREQEVRGSIDTPGGLEHMGDVWSMLDRWDKMFSAPDASRSRQEGE